MVRHTVSQRPPPHPQAWSNRPGPPYTVHTASDASLPPNAVLVAGPSSHRPTGPSGPSGPPIAYHAGLNHAPPVAHRASQPYNLPESLVRPSTFRQLVPLQTNTSPGANATSQFPGVCSQAQEKADFQKKEIWDHWSGNRIFTDAIMAEALREQYPKLMLTIVPEYGIGGVFDPLGYANAGNASYTPLDDNVPESSHPASLMHKLYVQAPHRQQAGAVAETPIYGKYLYNWQGHEFILYLAEHVGGSNEGYAQMHYYFLNGTKPPVDSFIRACGDYSVSLHDEIWVFDQGFWSKNAELYANVMEASWDNVILDADMKKGIQNDVLRFFRSQDRYANLKVPWKRGVIYYGPPGNGKTISIKALMHTLYKLKEPIPSLYVRTLRNVYGPEYSVASIFRKAREMSPCLLIFEDLDSIVSDDVRSYFLNEVDGISSNDGVFMIGSTNHLDRLDPGIAKRPSRFDRKWFFNNPDMSERILYSEFWRAKLSGNKDLEFPKGMCVEIAEITDDFSFAYMQEAFVAALLAIAELEEDFMDKYYGSGGLVNKADLIPWDYDGDIDERDADEEDDDDDDGDENALNDKFRLLEVDGAPTTVPMSKTARVRFAAHTAYSHHVKKQQSTYDGSKDKYDDLLLWRVLKKQIEILRDQIDSESVTYLQKRRFR